MALQVPTNLTFGGKRHILKRFLENEFDGTPSANKFDYINSQIDSVGTPSANKFDFRRQKPFYKAIPGK